MLNDQNKTDGCKTAIFAGSGRLNKLYAFKCDAVTEELDPLGRFRNVNSRSAGEMFLTPTGPQFAVGPTSLF
jgi:hypothetical protein